MASHINRVRGGYGVMEGRQVTSGLLLTALMLLLPLAGCTGAFTTVTPTARLSVDVDMIDVGEAVNFDARASTSPDPTLIVDYRWDFGTSQRNTTQGYVSQVFDEPGRFEIRLTVINDVGGEDSDVVTIYVNEYPIAAVSGPTVVKTSTIVTMDGSTSSDPEGGILEYAWDLDWSVDSNADGNFQNDIDDTNESTSFFAERSQNRTGSLTVTDDRGAATTIVWELRILERTFNVTWRHQTMKVSWDGYLQQGESYEINHIPGEGGRILEFNGTLELERDFVPAGLPPEDNFSMMLQIPDSSWAAKTKTTQHNITEASTGSIEGTGLNPYSTEPQTFTADSEDELLATLLAEPGARFGQGDWIWTITADEADPDIPIDGVDPDEGNNWTLEVEFVVLIPIILEVGLL